MSIRRALLLFAALAPSIAFGSGTPVRVYRDALGMPRCVEIPGKELRGVLLRWSTDSRYTSSVDAVWLKSVGIPMRLFVSKPICQDWPKWLGARGLKKRIDSNTSEVFGVPIPVSVRLAIAQIQNGASQYRSEKTGQEYLRKNPIADYTLALNRELTEKYGIGFASQIYGAYERSKPTNASFEQAVYKRVREAFQDYNRAQSELRNLTAGIKVLMVSGLGQDIKKPKKHNPVSLGNILEDLGQIGLDWEHVDNEPTGQASTNIPRVEEHIEKILSEGHKLIVIGQSKGTPEAFQAIANLERKWARSGARPSGKIVAFVNLSGVVTGSWVADYTDRSKFLTALKAVLLGLQLKGWDSEKIEKTYEHLMAFHDMSSQASTRRLRDYGSSLPKDISYINLIGTIPGNGLASEKNGVMTSPLVDKIQNIFGKYFVKDFGANDGYVEYPGMVLPDWVGVEQRSLIFNASHYVFDGKLGEWSMIVTPQRRRILTGLFLAILDLRWGKIP